MKNLILKIRNDYKSWKNDNQILSKHNLRLLIICFIVIMFGLSSLIRANINYIDDLGHSKYGYPEWGFNFFRWITTFANVIINVNWHLVDTSPLTQYLSMFAMAISVVIMAYIFSRIIGCKQIRISNFLASLVLAFNPYFLECYSYKYDSIGMSLSVLFSIIPFLFIDKKRLFYLSSIVCVAGMWLSYQASSGIYMILVITIGILDYSTEKIELKELIEFFLFSALVYLLTVGVIYFISLNFIEGYRSTSINHNLFLAIYEYAKSFYRCIMYDFNRIWSILVLLSGFSAFVSFIKISKKNSIISAISFLIFIGLIAFLSYGVYLVLLDNASSARMLYGFGIFLAIVCNISVLALNKKYVSIMYIIFPVLLLWCFFSYSFTYGNMLNYQREYEENYAQMIQDDLNELMTNGYEHYYAYVLGNVGFSPIVNRTATVYPITHRMVPSLLVDWHWGGYETIEYFNNRISKLSETDGKAMDLSTFDTVRKTMFYEIYSSDNVFIIKMTNF